MTTEELRVRLSTDPNFIFSYIYGNNPDAVIDNLRGLGFIINNADDVFNAINELHERGDDNLLIQAFTVPLLTDQISPAELAVITDVMSGQQHATTGVQKRLQISAETWTGIAGLAVGLIGAFAGGGKPVQQTSTTAAAPAAAQKDKTLTYVLVGVGGLVAVVVLILLLRKK